MDIWFATNNAHKKAELEAVLNTSLKIPSDYGIEFDPEETGKTFLENALLKARELKKIIESKDKSASGSPVIADDSGLCVDALGGRPGIFSARYGSVNGKKLSSSERNNLLLDELKDNPLRSARFVCSMALLLDDDRFFIAQETFEGEIVKSIEFAKGEGGFGYDPVLYIPQLKRTVAQLSAEEKNIYSHRGKAGKHIAALLENIIK
ncbi:MAG: non-canonical purine NTP pyrophosphatase [Treponema sp.]|nr:non-canonical purine NTP pyrophosphatase [Treponema sp.]